MYSFSGDADSFSGDMDSPESLVNSSLTDGKDLFLILGLHFSGIGNRKGTGQAINDTLMTEKIPT